VAAVPTDAQLQLILCIDLYATTTQRAGVYLRAKSYLERLLAACTRRAVTARCFWRALRGSRWPVRLSPLSGTKALYKDGGSVREHTEVQAPYALQWEIMRWLKAHGV
jgi:lipid II:glycine glycyltransferase (peptidoglycan interpeptide bridge formation enzyme)